MKRPINEPSQSARPDNEIHRVVIRSVTRSVRVCDCIDAVGRLAAWGGCGEPFFCYAALNKFVTCYNTKYP